VPLSGGILQNKDLIFCVREVGWGEG